MKLLFEVNEQTIVRKDDKKVVAHSRNYLQASFTFSAEWSGVKTAVFKRESEVYNVTLENDMCLVPWQVLNGQGSFGVSVFCNDLITTNMEVIKVSPSGYAVANPPSPPVPLEIVIKSYAGQNGVRYFKYENEELLFLSNTGEWIVASGGKSAYDIAVLNGYEGTESEWLDSLTGSTGKSAYDLAVINGFEGTEQEWLNSLHGRDGANGIDGQNGEDAKNLEVQATDTYIQWRREGEEWHNLIENPQFHKCIAIYSITNLIEGVSAEFRLNPVVTSKAMVKYAVFADDENISGLLTLSSGFTTIPVVFESDRISIKFYNANDSVTLTTVLKQIGDFGIMKHGLLNVMEG